MHDDVEEEKQLSLEMIQKIADLDQQNEYLQRKLSENCKDFKSKDNEIEKLKNSLRALKADNIDLSKKLDNFRDAYQSHEQLMLIQECKKNAKQRTFVKALEKEESQLNQHPISYKQKMEQQNFELKVKTRIFDASRRAAEILK